MLDHLWRISLNHPPNHRQRNRPDWSEFPIILLKEIIQLCARDHGKERHVAEKWVSALGFFEVWATTGSDGMGAVFVEEEGGNGEKELEVVGFWRVLERGFD